MGRSFAFILILALIVGIGVVLLRAIPHVAQAAADRRRSKERQKAFERSTELIALLSVDPELARQVLEGLQAWSRTQPRRVAEEAPVGSAEHWLEQRRRRES